MRLFLEDEAMTLEMAYLMSQCLSPGLMIYLEGGLGAGKTTFCRGLMRGLGHDQAVKSPTFTVVEPYQLRVSTFITVTCTGYLIRRNWITWDLKITSTTGAFAWWNGQIKAKAY